jgi:hypothetical protein
MYRCELFSAMRRASSDWRPCMAVIAFFAFRPREVANRAAAATAIDNVAIVDLFMAEPHWIALWPKTPLSNAQATITLSYMKLKRL